MSEKIFFKNSKGDRLCGILSRTKSGKEKSVVVMCHGFSSSKNSRSYVALEEVLNKNNITTFRYDCYGHGESDGKLEGITILEAVDDAFQAIKFVKKQGYKKIGLVGSSFGGMVGILVASKSKDLSFLALRAPVSDYLGTLISQISKTSIDAWRKDGHIYYKGKHKLNYSFFKAAKKVDGYKAAKKIKIPTLIIHGDKDGSVPIQQSKKTAKLIKDCRLEVIKGADHVFSKPKDFDRITKLVSEFIIEHS